MAAGAQSSLSLVANSLSALLAKRVGGGGQQHLNSNEWWAGLWWAGLCSCSMS